MQGIIFVLKKFKSRWGRQNSRQNEGLGRQRKLKGLMQVLRAWMEKTEEIRAMGQGAGEDGWDI